MLKNRIIPAMVAAAVVAGMGGIASAEPSASDHNANIEKECKAQHRDDTKAYNACVQERQKEHQNGSNSNSGSQTR